VYREQNEKKRCKTTPILRDLPKYIKFYALE
jgi:hypothetical protein